MNCLLTIWLPRSIGNTITWKNLRYHILHLIELMNSHLHHLMKIPCDGWTFITPVQNWFTIVNYRGVPRGLWVGVFIALPSGIGVALSVLGGNSGSLIGVAISASLLPPAVNAVSIITGIWYLEKMDTKLNLFFSRDNELLLVIAELQMQDVKVIAIYFFNNLTLIVMYFLIGLKKVFHIV